MSLARRYRWELAPLLIGASVVWLRPLLPDETTGVLALWYVGFGSLLAVGMVRVSRLGRPLLTALWAVTLVRLGFLAYSYAVIALLPRTFGVLPTWLGLLHLPAAIGMVAAVVWLASRQGVDGHRYAMLVCAGYLVPGVLAGPSFASVSPDHGAAVVALVGAGNVLHLASLVAVAVAFGAFGTLAAERQRRVVALLLALPVAAAVLRGVLLLVQLDVPPLSLVPAALAAFAYYAGTLVVVLGLTWLVTAHTLRRRRSAHTGV